jgi:AraC-like DNA-binding protein
MPNPKIFTTEGLPAKDAYEIWRSRDWPSLAPLWDTTPLEGRFYAHTEIFGFRDFSAIKANMSELHYSRHRSIIRGDEIDHFAFMVRLDGSQVAESGGRSSYCARGVAIADMAKPTHFTQTATRQWTIVIPRHLVNEVFPSTDGIYGVSLPSERAQPIIDYVRAMAPHFACSSPTSGPALARAFLHVLSVCMDYAPDPEIEPAAQAVLQIAARRRAVALIDQHLANPSFNAEGLAKLMGVSRSALYRLFEESDGVAELIRSRRLQFFCAALADIHDERSIAAKARACGFASAMQLNRVFQRVHGMRPSDYRAMALKETPKR